MKLFVAIAMWALLLSGPSTARTDISTRNGPVAAAAQFETRHAIPRLVKKTIKETNRRQKIDIVARYPQIAGGTSADFNRHAEELVRREIAKFKNDLDPPDDESRMRSLEIGYSAVFIDSRVISIAYWAGKEWGGAHPYSWQFVLNYDLTAKREIMLGDLFRPASGHLQSISNFCIARLRTKVLDIDTLREGAAAETTNYENWTIGRAALTITFNAYQVASYAEGPQTCVVPYARIKGLVARTGPIGHLIK